MFQTRMIPTLAFCLCAISSIGSAQAQNSPKKLLSLQDAIQAALENNLSLEMQRTTWRGTLAAGTMSAEAAFELSLGANVGGGWLRSGSSTNTTLPIGGESVNVLQETSGTTNSKNVSLTLSKPFQWGGTANFSYSPRYSSSSSETTYTLLDPPFTVYPGRNNTSPTPYSGQWSFGYTQDLLKNFGRKSATADLVIARRGLDAANANFRNQLQAQVAAAERAYWALALAQMNLSISQQSLELSQRQLRENKIRWENGVIAPIEVTNSEAEVARQEVTIINAETNLKDAKENFFRAIFATTDVPDDIELTDSPTVSQITLNEQTAIETAFNNRAEIRTSRIALEDAKLREELAHSNLKPTLRAQVTYNGSANSAAELSPINSDLTSFRYPGFNASLNFSMPLFNKAAKAQETNAMTNRRRAELSLKDQELAITLEVRQALRGLQSAEKSIVAAEKSLIYSQAAFDAAQMRYLEGLGTQLEVLQRQRDLDNAKTQNANAKIQYANAQTALMQAMGTLLEYRNIKVK